MSKIIMVTSGGYSDYEVHGLYRVPDPGVEWIVDRLEYEWLPRYPEQRGSYCFRLREFLQFLLLAGAELLEPPATFLASDEWIGEFHLDSYGSLHDSNSPRLQALVEHGEG
jgi:hypothetical protein